MADAGRSTVALLRCPTYGRQQVLAAARRAFDLLGGLERFVSAGQRVLVKPNLLSARPPEKAVTTHPDVVWAVVTLCREAGAEVWVGDSPGGMKWHVTAKAYEETGIGPAAVDAGAELLDFETAERQSVECPDGVILKRFAIAKPVLDADVVISLPKLKTHGQALYTGAVKNLLGCVPGGGKIRVHQLAPLSRDLWAALLDIYAVVRPSLTLIDGIVAMEGNGPARGDPRELGLLIASGDCVAADAVACHVIGYPLRSVHFLGQAAERGLGAGVIADIDVVGEVLADCVCPDFRRASNLLLELIPGFLARLLGRAVRVEPEIVQELCRECGLCQRSCPVEAIHGDGPLEIHPRECIRCFCCHELCPHDAVALRPSFLVRLYQGHRERRHRRKEKARQEAGEERC